MPAPKVSLPPMGPGRLAAATAALLAVTAGGGLGGYTVASGFSHPAAPDNSYHETAPCAGCPAGISLDSVEVQARQGSTLFVVRGAWPASADGLRQNVRLVAGDAEVVLHPHGSGGAFDVAGAPKGTTVAAGIQQGALLVDVAPALSTPVSFELGLWDGSAYTGRLPRRGRLAWSGSGAPAVAPVAAASPSPSVAPSPAGTPSAAVPGSPLALVEQCSSIPQGFRIPSYLQPAIVGTTPPLADPRTGQPRRRLVAEMFREIQSASKPYVVVGIVSHAGETAPTGQSTPIDRAGNEQLILSFDGAYKHKDLRVWSGGAWGPIQDAPDSLTIDISAQKVTFSWADLADGDRVGLVTGDGSVCVSKGLDGQLQPTLH